jgi:hypothetical protein
VVFAMAARSLFGEIGRQWIGQRMAVDGPQAEIFVHPCEVITFDESVREVDDASAIVRFEPTEIEGRLMERASTKLRRNATPEVIVDVEVVFGCEAVAIADLERDEQMREARRVRLEEAHHATRDDITADGMVEKPNRRAPRQIDADPEAQTRI